MRKFVLFTLLLLSCVGVSSCSKTDPGDESGKVPEVPQKPKLLVMRENDIHFTASATEEVEVKVETALSWDVTSNKTWCQVAKSGDLFRVSATANTQTAEPEQATITVSAQGADPVTLKVTQSAAINSLPTEAEDVVKMATAGTWTFTDGDWQTMTLYYETGNFVIIPSDRASKGSVGDDPLPPIVGTFNLGADKVTFRLFSPKAPTHTLTPGDFVNATVKFVSVNNETASVEVMVGNTPAATRTIKMNIINHDQAMRRKLTFFQANTGSEGTLTYLLNWRDNKLQTMDVKLVKGSSTNGAGRYTVNYVDRKTVRIDFTQTAPTTVNVSALFKLDGYGVATSVQYRDNATQRLEYVANLVTSPTGRLTYSMVKDFKGKLVQSAKAVWTDGNMVSNYTKTPFPWDEDGDNIPDQDFNGDQEIDMNDIIPWSYNTYTYQYSQIYNESQFYFPFEMPEVYCLDKWDIYYVAYLTGIMGGWTREVMSGTSGRMLEYLYDSERYPYKLHVIEPSHPEDNFDCDMKFEWVNK